MIFNLSQGAVSEVQPPNHSKEMTLPIAPNCTIRAGDFIYYGSVNFGTTQYPGYFDAIYPIDYTGEVISNPRYAGVAKTGASAYGITQPSVYIYAYMTSDTPNPSNE